MTSIIAKVTGTHITLQVNGPLTCGMVGLPIEFSFDGSWQVLNKTVVFRAGGLTKDRVNIEKHTTVPWEVMKKAGCRLQIGVYGTSKNGDLVIPTVWGVTDPIEHGADPSGDESAKPTLPIWEQLQSEINEIKNKGGGATTMIVTIHEQSDGSILLMSNSEYIQTYDMYNHVSTGGNVVLRLNRKYVQLNSVSPDAALFFDKDETGEETVYEVCTDQVYIHEHTLITRNFFDEKIGDISSALTELHNYAETLKGGDAV